MARPRTLVCLFVLVVATWPGLAPALGLPGWRTREVEVNGLTVQEIRLGTIVDRGELAIAVVTNGSTPGTTRLLVSRIQMFALMYGALPTWLTLVQSGSAFSLGGGCAVGETIVFPYIDGFRLRVARVAGNQITTTTPSIAGNDQYVATECAQVGDTTYYALLNDTRQRIELYAEDANGFRSENAGFANVLSVFSGAVRPALAAGVEGRLGIVYQQTSGSVRQVSFDAATKAIESNCQLALQMPAPTSFTNVRETTAVPGAWTGNGSEYRFGALGDFVNGGANTLTHFVSGGGCANWSVGKGSSTGVAPYGWLGSVAIIDKLGTAAYVGNASVWGRVDYEFGLLESLPPPPHRSGGPIDGVGVRDNDTRRFAVLVAGVSDASATRLELNYNALPRGVGNRWRSGFEDSGPRFATSNAPPGQ
jgi:hypothetical protein